jgi:hypothetical protein
MGSATPVEINVRAIYHRHLTRGDIVRTMREVAHVLTTKSRLPNSLRLVRLYLKIPLLWRIFGQQTFVVAEPARRECQP